MLIEPEAKRIHQDRPQQAIAQVPQIAGPEPFEATAVGHLSKDGIHQVAHPVQHRALGGLGFGRRGAQVRGQQHHGLLPHFLLDAWHPIIAIAQVQARGALRQHGAISHSCSLAVPETCG